MSASTSTPRGASARDGAEPKRALRTPRSRSSKRAPRQRKGLGMLGSGIRGSETLGSSDDGLGKFLTAFGMRFSIPGGSFAEPRVALNDSADSAPLAVVMR